MPEWPTIWHYIDQVCVHTNIQNTKTQNTQTRYVFMPGMPCHLTLHRPGMCSRQNALPSVIPQTSYIYQAWHGLPSVTNTDQLHLPGLTWVAICHYTDQLHLPGLTWVALCHYIDQLHLQSLTWVTFCHHTDQLHFPGRYGLPHSFLMFNTTNWSGYHFTWQTTQYITWSVISIDLLHLHLCLAIIYKFFTFWPSSLYI